MSELLLIEVGGTHTRCAVARGEGAPQQLTVFRNADYQDLESAVAAYLAETTVAPERAALAVAAPVDMPSRRLTNIHWTLDVDALARRFGWTSATIVNDFEALACAVPVLAADELLDVRPGEPAPGHPIAVLGPGTGFGVSGLVPCGEHWYPIAGEGGHVTLPAANDREEAALRALRGRYGHVSAERVLSGPGLAALYRTQDGAGAVDSPLDVTRLAESGDRAATRTLDLFFGFLATVCGDLALTLGARGGVYLGGGILPALRDRLTAPVFQERFADKGRFAEYLDKVPVYLILADTPALRGLRVHPRVTAVGAH